jgi:hypothetical protein
MPFSTDLPQLLSILRAWWQRQLDKTTNGPPYPLSEDEWEFIQQREEARCQGREAAATAEIWVDKSGKLINFYSGRSIQY